MWRDPGGSGAGFFKPAQDKYFHPAKVCVANRQHLCKVGRCFFKNLRWITADPSPWGNFTPPMKQECGETLGDLKPVYDLFMMSQFSLPKAVTDRWHLCKADRFSYGKSPWTPPLEGTSLHRRKIVWRDPGGSGACLRPVYGYHWSHPTKGCDTDNGVFMKLVGFLTVS